MSTRKLWYAVALVAALTVLGFVIIGLAANKALQPPARPNHSTNATVRGIHSPKRTPSFERSKGASHSPLPSVLARAQAICAGRAAPSSAVTASSGTDLVTAAAQRSRVAHELAALSGPPSSTESYRRLASLIAVEAKLLRELARDSASGNDVGALAVERRLRRSTVSRQALAVGLTSCA